MRSVAGRWSVLAAVTALLGCSAAMSDDVAGGTAPPDDADAVTGTAPADPTAPAKAGAFACAGRKGADEVRVDMRMDMRFGAVDATGAEIPGSSIGGAEATYRVRLPGDAGGARRAELVLEEALPSHGTAQNKSAWEAAVQKGWIEPGRPFRIEQSGDGWCWPGPGGCDTSDAARAGFAKSVGLNVDLVYMMDDLAPALDGLTNTGGLSIPLPPRVARRLGLQGEAFMAQAAGPGYPARFVVTRSRTLTTEKKTQARDGTTVKEPQNNYMTLEAAFVVDVRCRLLELRRVDGSFTPFFEGKLPSGARITRTLEWRFTPTGA